jgi:RNA polymerase sigma factor (sigma-70 family)
MGAGPGDQHAPTVASEAWVIHGDERGTFGDSESDDLLPQLVSKAVGGDQSAWNEIVQRFSGRVWAICRAYRLGPADAADVFQQTWLRVLENLGSLRDPARLGAWIKTTGKHEALRALRRAKRDQPVGDWNLLDRPVDATESPDRPVLIAARNADLWQAFLRLTPRCQDVLRVLVVEADDGRPSYQHASAVLDIPIGGLGPTRRRCLDRLRGFLTEGIGGAAGASWQ